MTEFSCLPKNPYSLGLVVRYVAADALFAGFEFGPSVGTCLHQINNRTHIVAIRDDAIVGYLGWLRTTDQIAEAWLNREGRLTEQASGSAIAVTVLVVDRPSDILPMLKAAKRAEPGFSVFWKRYFADGRPPERRHVRKKS